MIALSIRQPWAWAIVHAKKRIENRGWSTAYRGPILLHAAKGCTANEYAEAMQWMLFAGVLTHQQLADAPELGEMQRGGIVGRARIVAAPHHRHRAQRDRHQEFPHPAIVSPGGAARNPARACIVVCF